MTIGNIKLSKTQVIGGIILILLILIVGSCTFRGTSDSRAFKREYEKLNGKKASDDYEYQSLSIDKKNKIKYVSLEEAEKIIKEGTGIVYFGMPECPWCRGMVPVLLESADCSCIENIYYVNMKEERNTYEIKDDEPVETKEASEAYYSILSLLDEFLDVYKIKDENGFEHILQTKRVYLPTLVAVKDGIVKKVHTGSVELDASQSPYDELSDVQKSEMRAIVDEMVEIILEEPAVCDGKC